MANLDTKYKLENPKRKIKNNPPPPPPQKKKKEKERKINNHKLRTKKGPLTQNK